MAVLWQYSIDDGIGFLSPILLAQIITPLAVGWWFVRRKREQSYPVTTFWIFAVSPLVSLVFLWCASYLVMFLVSLQFPFPRFDDEHFGHVALVALANTFNLLMVIVPSIAASLFYCNLAKRLDLGKKWMLVSCAVLGLFAASYCFSVTSADPKGHYYLHDGLGFWNPIRTGPTSRPACFWLVVHPTPESSGPCTTGVVKALGEMAKLSWCDQLRQQLLQQDCRLYT